ncbi:MAG: Response regulator of zinc sigma-54-dependent two-component system [uncultured Gemmatimonadetes bacterium]|uniref:Response regulator of zinc sigma-54-dependent two-component system n=1 Tax=uncultured Gemmatimonadota bacterium TaxID=203437 RepID=A0A6J4KCN8_9BACT|nr:MAG: Response regulator of zinc sigma-54-dependent two-component system [uncultured Gemmatimonadota bacterium]
MPEKILVADDERHIAEGLQMLLADEGYEVDTATDGNAAWKLVQEKGYGVVLADLRMPQVDGLELFGRMRKAGIPSEMIIITGEGSVDTAKEAMREGAYDYLEKPLKIDRLKELIPKALEKFQVKQANKQLEERLANLTRFVDLIGQSEEMRSIYSTIEAAAPTTASMLIVGESGTGKELVARAIHEKSNRAKGPFIAINCAAFPREILENELFGHEKGAFTGAINEKQGCFELADGGTLFLDEVAEMEPDIQVKFLRALEQRSFRRLGGKKEIHVDIRVVSATNKQIGKAIDDGKLREDLYHRLAVIPLFLPPLRERRGDVRLLAESFLRRFSEENSKKNLKSFSPEALEFINAYRWPGNVRELENAVERAVIFARTEEITLGDLRAHELIGSEDREVRVPVGTSLQQAERTLVLKTFSFVEGDHNRAASMLGIEEDELRNRLNQLVAGETVPA